MSGKILVGTVGFRHLHWAGRFYPRGLAQRGFLGHYAERFDAVELPLDGLHDLRQVTHAGRCGLQVLVTLPTTWLHLPPGKLPFHPGLELIDELSVSGALVGVRLPLEPDLAPTRDHARRLRRLAKVFADHGLVIDLPRGRWRSPAVFEWLERIAVSSAWTVPVGRLEPPEVTGPLGVVRILAPGVDGPLDPDLLATLLPGLRAVSRGRALTLVLLQDRGPRGDTAADAAALQALLRQRGLLPSPAPAPPLVATGAVEQAG
jgi:hypothetical protein